MPRWWRRLRELFSLHQWLKLTSFRNGENLPLRRACCCDCHVRALCPEDVAEHLEYWRVKRLGGGPDQIPTQSTLRRAQRWYNRRPFTHAKDVHAPLKGIDWDS